MHDMKSQIPQFPMNPNAVEIAFISSMTAAISELGWESRFDYEPGHELSVELSASGHIVSGLTPEGSVTFDLAKGLDLKTAWARFERELVALHIMYDQVE